ncbi:MAG: hypothetical protein M1358_21730, partial [Chloroflexi bacterium]|nr:hypothetical protein [Chloroflexota bacterium]
MIFKGKTEGVYDSLLAPSEDLFLDEETELEEKLRDSFRLHDQENTPHSSPSIQDYDGRSWEDQVPQYAPVYALDSPLRTQTGLAEPVPGYGQFDRIELNYQASGGWFSRKHYLELQTSRSAELGVAKAIWSLWKGSRNKIWMILQEWVLGDPTLLDASREILRTGLESDHISAEEALSILETWLLSDERDHQVAAAQLLKVIPPDYLFPATMGWKSRFEERHRNALSMVMRPS